VKMTSVWKDEAVMISLPPEVSEADYLGGVMLFENNPRLIESYLFHMSKNRQISLKGDWERDHYWTEIASESPTYQDLEKSIARSTKRGLIAGWFLLALYAMENTGVKEPSKIKAREIVSKHYLSKKWGDDSYMKSSSTSIETIEKEYQNVAHLWAAFAINHVDLFVYSEPAKKALLGEDFAVFLQVAKMFENFGLLYLDTRNKKEKPVISSLSPWLLSEDIAPNKLTLSTDIDWLQPYLN